MHGISMNINKNVIGRYHQCMGNNKGFIIIASPPPTIIITDQINTKIQNKMGTRNKMDLIIMELEMAQSPAAHQVIIIIVVNNNGHQVSDREQVRISIMYHHQVIQGDNCIIGIIINK